MNSQMKMNVEARMTNDEISPNAQMTKARCKASFRHSDFVIVSCLVIRHSSFQIMNIGFVGVGRMGANMARRLKDRGFHVTAVYDTNRAAATELASELGCAAAQDLSEVTAASDVIFTVVTDDNAMRQIFAGRW